MHSGIPGSSQMRRHSRNSLGNAFSLASLRILPTFGHGYPFFNNPRLSSSHAI
jgi:hypothetical protein